MHKIRGSCVCENLTFRAALEAVPSTLQPRACDCDFCRKHRAAYLSDPKGTLEFHVKNESGLSKYRHGSKTAEFLVCRECGVLVGVVYQKEGSFFGAINARAADDVPFADDVTVSPKKLEPAQKTNRWEEVWFPNVVITTN